jgi:ABC-type sugar transport system permease subunit
MHALNPALMWKHRVFYFFVIPFAALTIVFGLWPIVLSVQVSFTESYTALQPDPTYVGLENYLKIFADTRFLSSLYKTIEYTALSVIFNVSFALAYALFLTSRHIARLGTLFRLAIFLPVITPDIAGYIVWKWMYNQNFGAVNAFLTALGLPEFGGIASTNTAMAAILIAELWKHAGFYVIIFLTNIMICDPHLEEAARVDGAGYWKRIWYVVIPQLRPAIMINSVYALIQFLKTFSVVVVMTKGGPNFETNYVSYYAYQLFDEARYGEATAMASTLFVLVIGLAYLVYWLNSRSDWR